jgi:hypothetical protein
VGVRLLGTVRQSGSTESNHIGVKIELLGLA